MAYSCEILLTEGEIAGESKLSTGTRVKLQVSRNFQQVRESHACLQILASNLREPSEQTHISRNHRLILRLIIARAVKMGRAIGPAH
jgi:hypothetical protein